MIPLEESGKPVTKLDYELKKDQQQEGGMCLNCENISDLADAIQNNTVFKGDLDLEY